jgi:hypothetical protein
MIESHSAEKTMVFDNRLNYCSSNEFAVGVILRKFSRIW